MGLNRKLREQEGAEAPAWLQAEHREQAEGLWAQALEEALQEEAVPVAQWWQQEQQQRQQLYAQAELPAGPDPSLVKLFRSLAKYLYEGQSLSNAVVSLLNQTEPRRLLTIVFPDAEKWYEPIMAVEPLQNQAYQIMETIAEQLEAGA